VVLGLIPNGCFRPKADINRKLAYTYSPALFLAEKDVIVGKFFRGSFGQSVTELALIVAGVLIALGVDEWRADREEKFVLQQHLLGVVQEIDANLRTLHAVRNYVHPQKIQALEEIIAILSQPEPDVENSDSLIRTLITSSRDVKPWFVRGRFEGFQVSASFGSRHLGSLASDITDVFEAPSVLFEQPLAFEGNYSEVVWEMVPARYLAELGPLRTYVSDTVEHPPVADGQPAEDAVKLIIKERSRLVRLGRNEAAAAIGKWYAMTRIMADFDHLRALIAGHPVMQDVDLPETNELPEL
jgi:hypothetical protein